MAGISSPLHEVCIRLDKEISLPHLIRACCNKLDKDSIIKSATLYPDGPTVVLSFDNEKDKKDFQKHIKEKGTIGKELKVKIVKRSEIKAIPDGKTVKLKSTASIKEATNFFKTSSTIKHYCITIHMDTTITLSAEKSPKVFDELKKSGIIEDTGFLDVKGKDVTTKTPSRVEGANKSGKGSTPDSRKSVSAPENLTTAGRPMPTKNRNFKDGASATNDSLTQCIIIPCIDKRSMKYIHLKYEKQLQSIREEYGVTIFSCEDNTLKFQTTDDRNNEERLLNAKEQFIQFYQKVYGKLDSETISLGAYPSLRVQDLNEITRKVEKKDVSMSMCRNGENTTEIMFIGEKQNVEDAKMMCENLLDQHTEDTRSNFLPPVPSVHANINSASAAATGSSQNYYKYTFVTGVTISIYVGDITRETTDIIVNAANSHLDHKGGVALAISRAAGKRLNEECRAYMSKKGPIHVTCNIVTSGGNLPCKYVLHAVGPNTYHGEDTFLRTTIDNIFEASQKMGIKSMAMPALSTGIYGLDKQTFAHTLLRSFNRRCVENPHPSSLFDVRIVDIDTYTIQTIVDKFNSKWPMTTVHATSPRATSGPQVKAIKSFEHLYLEQGPYHTTTDQCVICQDDFTCPVKLRACGHMFCKECVDRALDTKCACPVCFTILGVQLGPQPENGEMEVTALHQRTPGFLDAKKTIQITYSFPNGIQSEKHPHPGYPYSGTKRVAFLPDNHEGRAVLKLLEKAFKARLTFTVGTSHTTGKSDTVVWNDIHHKTSIQGGPYGYPDADYLTRVQQELAYKGIK